MKRLSVTRLTASFYIIHGCKTLEMVDYMSLTPEEVVRYIQKSEDENWLAECIYFGAVKGLDGVRSDLSKLDDTDHIDRILNPFLIQWGMMAQPLARKGMKWAQLGAKLRKLEPHFKTLREESLLHIKFEDQANSAHIEEIYEELDSIKFVGPTAVSKILHLINPEIFIMWDKEIRGMYNVADSSSGYLEFLGKNQRLLKTVFDDKQCNDLRSKFHKTLAKLIDEFNWYIANEDHTPDISVIKRKVKRIYGR